MDNLNTIDKITNENASDSLNLVTNEGKPVYTVHAHAADIKKVEVNITDFLKQVMQKNKDRCLENEILYESIIESRKNQQIISEKNLIKVFHNNTCHNKLAKVSLTQEKTIESVNSYGTEAGKIAVLSFANAFYPGGGVLDGAKAQEECVCRATTLYECLIDPKAKEKFYDKHRESHSRKMKTWGTSDIIYTPGVIIHNADDGLYTELDAKDFKTIDVITCAAPNLSSFKKLNKKDLNYEEKVIYNRLERVFKIAIANHVDTLILGAFGCGVFNNPPAVVAKVTRKLSEKYQKYFKNIKWAVYDPSPKKRNYTAFLYEYAISEKISGDSFDAYWNSGNLQAKAI